MEAKTIKKMTLAECTFNCDSAKLFIDNHDPENDLHKNMLNDARWAYLEWRDCIRIMKEHGKDYIYLKDGGGVLKYEIGDLLFPNN